MDAHALNAAVATPRLALEPLDGGHAAALFEPLSDPRLYAWISTAPPPSVERLAAAWARLAAERRSPDGSELWLAWALRERGGGYVGKVDATVDGDGVAQNVGYILFADAWGRGLATEAVGAVTAALRAHGVGPLYATVTRGNAASCRVLEKCGYRFTRILPANDVIRGIPHDDLEYVHDGA